MPGMRTSAAPGRAARQRPSRARRAVPGGDDLEALQPQVDLHEAEDVGVVIGHEHGGSQHASLAKKLGGVLPCPPRAASSAPARPTSPYDTGAAGPRPGCPSVATTR